MAVDPKKDPLGNLDPAFAKLVRDVQSNTEAELRELNKLPAKYTQKTGMIDPDLDIGPTPYDPKAS